MQMPSDTTLPMIEGAAEKLGLDWPKLQHDMQSPAIQQQIDTNLRLAQALNIDGTPALVIGNSIVPGALSLADLQKEVAAAQETAKR
jgi:protein-disulfide isomerase